MTHLLQISDDRAAEFQSQIIAHVRSNVPGAIRASIGLHNTPADLEYLCTALQAILDRKFSDTYQLDLATGEYAPAGWNPKCGDYFQL